MKIAVVSPSFAAPAYGPEVHSRAIERLTEITGMQVIETPTTRNMGATAQQRAHDLNDVYADKEVGCIISTTGGNDEITILRHLDEQIICANPKPFLGYSDNTHLLNWLWNRKQPGFYGGSTQVHIGTGPAVDPEHLTSLRAVLGRKQQVQITNPETTEDRGHDWQDPRALTEYGPREPMPEWQWVGPSKEVAGKTWGGCVESLTEVLLAGALRDDTKLDGAVLLLETSEQLIDPITYGSFLRALGERGLLERCAAVMFAHPPTSTLHYTPTQKERQAYRRDLLDLSFGVLQKYAPHAVGVFGVPFGHTRPQWIFPYGGIMELNPAKGTVYADYDWTIW